MSFCFIKTYIKETTMQHEKEISEILDSVNIIQIVSFEWERIDAILAKVANEVGKRLYKWNIAQGLFAFDDEHKKFDIEREGMDSGDVLEWFQEVEASDSIVILEDFYPFLDGNSQNIRIFRNIARGPKDKTLILSQPFQSIPQELDKDVHTIALDLSSKGDLEVIFRQCVENSKYELDCDESLKDRLIETALGLTIMEARKVFTRAIVRSKGKIGENEIKLIVAEKERIIKNSGFLEYYHHKEGISDIGGLDALKDWLTKEVEHFITMQENMV